MLFRSTGHIARECYGVVDLVGQGSVNSKIQLTKGIKIITVGNRIYIDLFAILKYGVSIGTVTDNLKSAVKYGVESYKNGCTGKTTKNRKPLI